LVAPRGRPEHAALDDTENTPWWSRPGGDRIARRCGTEGSQNEASGTSWGKLRVDCPGELVWRRLLPTPILTARVPGELSTDQGNVFMSEGNVSAEHCGDRPPQ